MTKSKRFRLDPTAMELAKLAISLCPNLNARAADQVRKAFEFYVEAMIFCRECAPLSLEELVGKFRNQDQVAIERWAKAREALWKDTLELNPEKESDPARDYLGECDLRLKTVPAVLDNVRKAWRARRPDLIPDSFDIVAHCKKSLNGKAFYLIPRFLLSGAVTISKINRKRSMRKWRARSSPKKSVK